MEFSLYVREGGALVEGVAQFKYLGRPLNQTDENWLVGRRKVKRAWKFWGTLGKMLQMELV